MNARKITLTLFTAISFLAISTQAQVTSAYVHHANQLNITTSQSVLDTIALNGNGNLNMLVTHNYNPNGATGTYVDEKLGLRYQSQKWRIFNQDLSAFIDNTFYNVLIPGPDIYSWKHTSSNSNITQNYTIIDDGRINNNPNAMVFVFDQLANYNKEVIGVFYSTGNSKWCIYNQEGSNVDMEAALDFSIVVPKPNADYKAIIHTADGNNTSNHFTYLNHADLNNNPDAIIFVTQVWNPGGGSGVYNNHNVGVQYRNNNKWVVYNEDLANMPLGASFNVLIFKNNSIGVEEVELTNQNIKVFPNPTTAGTNVNLELDAMINGAVNVDIYSLTGQLVHSELLEKTTDTQLFALSTHGLLPGLYVVKIENEGKQGVQKLIIE